MSLFSEIGEAVDEVLSDPDMATADVRIRRVTGTTPGPEVWDDPVETYQILKLSVVVFTKDAKFSAGSLVVDRGDEITASPWATIIEEDGVVVNRRVPLEVRSIDDVIVDGDHREIIEIIRTPAAGPDVSVWQIRVAG